MIQWAGTFGGGAVRLELDLSVADGYKSPSQRARRMTEAWFGSNMYCPACASLRVQRCRCGTPVADLQSA